MRAVPAYRKLKQKIEKQAERNWITALDGGLLYVRSPHKAMNTSLQSAGALVAKQWAMQFEENLLDAGLDHGWDGDFVHCVHSHDEMQIAVFVPEIPLASYVNETDYGWVDEGDDKKTKAKIKALKEKHWNEWLFSYSPKFKFVAEQTKTAVTQTQAYFGIQCRLDSEFKIGRNWSDTH